MMFNFCTHFLTILSQYQLMSYMYQSADMEFSIDSAQWMRSKALVCWIDV